MNLLYINNGLKNADYLTKIRYLMHIIRIEFKIEIIYYI